jgi:hypothetical protein
LPRGLVRNVIIILLFFVVFHHNPSLDLSIFRAGPGSSRAEKISVISGRKILPMTIPLHVSGLNFRAGLGPGPGLGRPLVYFIV